MRIYEMTIVTVTVIIGIMGSLFVYLKFRDPMYIWYIPYVLLIELLYLLYSMR